jgi:hypothetical protein
VIVDGGKLPSDPYFDAHPEIVDISNWVVVSEEMSGASEKIWIRHPTMSNAPENRWLFKPVFVHANGTVQGGDWSERLSHEVAVSLGIPSAEIRCAVRGDTHGTLSRNIRPTAEWDRFEGGTWLDANIDAAYSLDGNRPSRRVRGASVGHSIEELARALAVLNAPPQASGPMSEFDGWGVFSCYMVLDALIANRDRHEQNWSILRPVLAGGQELLGAAYDNEGAFGYNLTDDQRDQLSTDANSLTAWLDRGTAWRFEWLNTEPVPQLARAARRALELSTPVVQDFAVEMIESFDPAEVAIERMPRMSDAARKFSRNLLISNKERLTNEFRDIAAR